MTRGTKRHFVSIWNHILQAPSLFFLHSFLYLFKFKKTLQSNGASAGTAVLKSRTALFFKLLMNMPHSHLPVASELYFIHFLQRAAHLHHSLVIRDTLMKGEGCAGSHSHNSLKPLQSACWFDDEVPELLLGYSSREDKYPGGLFRDPQRRQVCHTAAGVVLVWRSGMEHRLIRQPFNFIFLIKAL